MKFWRSMTLRMQIFSTILLLLSIIIALTCTFFYYRNVREIQNQTYALLGTLTEQYIKSTNLYIQDIEKMSISLFSDPLIQSNLIEEPPTTNENLTNQKNKLYTILFNQAYPRPDVVSIWIYDRLNNSYRYKRGISMEFISKSTPVTWQSMLDQISKSKYLLLPTHTEGDAQVVSLVRNIYSIPIRDKIGAVKIDIDANAIGSILANTQSSQMEQSMRVNRQGFG